MRLASRNATVLPNMTICCSPFRRTVGSLDIEPLIDTVERFGIRPVAAPKAPTPITEDDVGVVCYRVVLPGGGKEDRSDAAYGEDNSQRCCRLS